MVNEKKPINYEELVKIISANEKPMPEDAVILTKEEIRQAKKNKEAAYKKAAGFQNVIIYRTFHAAMRTLCEIILSMPKKSVKITDILLQNFAETIRWTAAAYNHKDEFLKQNALEESISLMSVVKIMTNSLSNLVGTKKHKQLVASLDAIMRQLVAWRGSIKQSEGFDDEAE